MSGKRQWSFQGDLKKAPQYALLGLFEDRLSVDGDFDQIADDNPALVQRRVPACAEVVAMKPARVLGLYRRRSPTKAFAIDPDR